MKILCNAKTSIPMELQEVKRLVYGGENQHVEFKRKVKYPEKIIKEIVAFANTDGGHLFIGVDDDKTITGVKFADEEDYIMQKAIAELCRPAIVYTAEIIPLNDENAVLHYYISESRTKPHFAFLKKEHRFGKAFIRIDDRSVQASAEIRRILKHKHKETTLGFEYGEHERKLLQYLDQHERITLREFIEISQLPIKKASDILVTLAVSNVIRIVPSEREDWFEFAE
jgi:predicted HTH transcriptional regulator